MAIELAPATTPIPDYVRRAFEPNPYRERVERGAALLDAQLPGWRERIDLAALDIQDECGCVLGQVFGNYARGLARLTGRWRSFEVGFNIANGYENYADLTAAWREYLTEHAR